MALYDVTFLLTCIPTADAREPLREQMARDDTLADRTLLTSDHICDLLDINTYLKCDKKLYRHGCAMRSPVSPIVANLYGEVVESRASSFPGITLSHRSDMWMTHG